MNTYNLQVSQKKIAPYNPYIRWPFEELASFLQYLLHPLVTTI